MLMSLILYSLLTASLAWFVQYTLEPGEIFGRYGLFLNAVWMRNWRRKDRWKRIWVKPAGQCVYCNGAWIAIIVFLVLFTSHNRPFIPQIVALFLFLGANYIWTKILSKVVE